MRSARVALALVAWAGATAHAEQSSCQQTLVPVHRPEPEYPSPEQAQPYLQGTSYMHVFVAGTITVELVVSREGTVSDARVISSDYKLVGRNASRYRAGYFDGFLELNVLSTVKVWRFAPILEPCTGEFRVIYQFEDAPNKPEAPLAK